VEAVFWVSRVRLLALVLFLSFFFFLFFFLTEVERTRCRRSGVHAIVFPKSPILMKANSSCVLSFFFVFSPFFLFFPFSPFSLL